MKIVKCTVIGKKVIETKKVVKDFVLTQEEATLVRDFIGGTTDDQRMVAIMDSYNYSNVGTSMTKEQANEIFSHLFHTIGKNL